MRWSILLLPILISSCGTPSREEPLFLDGFVELSHSVRCTEVASLTGLGGSINYLTIVGDSVLLALDRDPPRALVIAPDLELRYLLEIPEDHQDEPTHISSATIYDDTLIVIADQSSSSLRFLTLGGTKVDELELGFVPDHLTTHGDTLLITPIVIGNNPDRLLHMVTRSESDPTDYQIESLPIPTARYRDPLATSLANASRTVVFRDDRIVLSPLFIVPFARIIDMTKRVVAQAPLPLPDLVEGRYGWLPSRDTHEYEGDEILVVAMAITPDRKTGDFLYLTQTGRKLGASGERAIVRVDSTIDYKRSYLIDVNGRQIAYLPETMTSIVTTATGEWYRCDTP